MRTYDALIAEVKSHLQNRTNDARFNASLPNLVDLAHQRIRSDIRINEMVTQNRQTMVDGELPFPADAVELRSVVLDTDPKQRLDSVSPDSIDYLFPHQSTGRPQVYAVIGDKLQFGPNPDSNYGLLLTYWKEPDLPSPTNPTNPILTTYPDTYLYGTLMQAGGFLLSDQQIARWREAYSECVGRVNSIANNQENVRPRQRPYRSIPRTRWF